MLRLLFALVFMAVSTMAIAQNSTQETQSQGSQSSGSVSGSVSGRIETQQTPDAAQNGNRTSQQLPSPQGSAQGPSDSAMQQGEGQAQVGRPGGVDRDTDRAEGTNQATGEGGTPWLWLLLGLGILVVILTVALSGRRPAAVDERPTRVERMERREDVDVNRPDDMRRAG